jgi:hypothetical protein
VKPLDPAHILTRLAANAEVFQQLLVGVTEEQARWKPVPEKWSLLEVINHLADEEREDFRTRLDLTLHRPGEPWPRIDPQGWPAQRSYNARELNVSLADFLAERARSLEWLRGLPSIDLDSAYQHPRFGPIRAGDLFGSWLAHDLIHIRQMNRLHYEYFASHAAPYDLRYAGDW